MQVLNCSFNQNAALSGWGLLKTHVRGQRCSLSVEHLLGMHEALDSILTITKKMFDIIRKIENQPFIRCSVWNYDFILVVVRVCDTSSGNEVVTVKRYIFRYAIKMFQPPKRRGLN